MEVFIDKDIKKVSHKFKNESGDTIEVFACTSTNDNKDDVQIFMLGGGTLIDNVLTKKEAKELFETLATYFSCKITYL